MVGILKRLLLSIFITFIFILFMVGVGVLVKNYPYLALGVWIFAAFCFIYWVLGEL